MTFQVLGRRTGPLDEVRDWRRLEVLTTSTTYVSFSCPEVTALCAETKQRDFYDVDIAVHIAGVSIESKSLKLFLASFANVGIFAEGLATELAASIAYAIANAERVSDDEFEKGLVAVNVVQRSRGGISIHAEATCTLVDARTDLEAEP